MGSEHLSGGELERYFLRTLRPGERHKLERHLEICTECTAQAEKILTRRHSEIQRSLRPSGRRVLRLLAMFRQGGSTFT